MKTLLVGLVFFAVSSSCFASEPLEVCQVNASSDDGNAAANTVDGNLGSRWSTQSQHHSWVIFDLCGAYDLYQMDISWFEGDSRMYYHRIETSEKGEQWDWVTAQSSSGETLDFERYPIQSQNSRYVRIQAFGNTASDIHGINEVRIFGVLDPSEYALHPVTNLRISDVTATELTLSWDDNSDNEDAYGVEKIEPWAGEYHVYRTVNGNRIRITGLDRNSVHQFRVSPIKGDEFGPGVEIQSVFEFNNQWVYVQAVSASGHDGNVPSNAVDGSLSTRWSSQGDEEHITLDLGDRYVIDKAYIAWHDGDKRKASFKFSCSHVGDYFFEADDERGHFSSGKTSAYEEFDVPCSKEGVRFFRILGHGNTANNWNSISDIKLVGALTRTVN